MDIKDFMHMPKIKLAKNPFSSGIIQALINLGHSRRVIFQSRGSMVSWTQSGAIEKVV